MLAMPHTAISTLSSHVKLLTTALLTLLLIGCSSVQSTVIRFHQIDTSQPGLKQSGSIQVVAGDKRLQGTLAFDHHRAMLEQQLSAQGYRVVEAKPSTDDSDLVAFLSYGIDGGRTKTTSEPSGMTIGVGAGSVGRFGSLSYRMPLYAAPVESSRSNILYTSAIAVDIVERSSLNDGSPKRLYEGRVRSRSHCAAITPVFDGMLSALFEEFPGVSGQTQTKSIKSSGDSC